MMEESIYSLIPTPQFKPVKPALHRSKTSGKVEAGQFEMGVKTKKGHATFGKPNGASSNKPDTYIRAHSQEPILPEPVKPQVPKAKLKAPVPAATDKPVMGLCTNKNFVTANAVETILAKPNKVMVEEPRFTQKEDFGKVPAYLDKVKAKIEAENEFVRHYIEQRETQQTGNSAQQMS